MPSDFASYSVAQIRHAEQLALAQGRALMPLAGRAAAEFIAARYPHPISILVLAGPGNNGGDALTAASLLRERGDEVVVLLPSGPGKLPPDAAAAWRTWSDKKGPVLTDLPDQSAFDVVIDGLFGIGLNRPLAQAWQSLVDRVNAWRLPVLALDVPSGIDADTGAALGRPVQARWTLSFIGMARGLDVPGAGRNAAGERYVDTLGVVIATENGPATAL